MSELKKTGSETNIATSVDVSNAVSGVAHLSGNETFTGVKTFNQNLYVGDGSSENIIITRTDIRKMTNGSSKTYSFPTSAGTLALATDIPNPRYEFYSPAITTSGTTISAVLHDQAINSISIGSDITTATFTFPAKTTGYARDFFVRLTITGDIPEIVFEEPDGAAISVDVIDDEWANIEQGVNLIMFTETVQ